MNGVRFLHSKGIFHRDLKPLNILISNTFFGLDIKICDFGSSNVQTVEINKDYRLTKWVTTRHYRSPELYLMYKGNYTTSLDMWSIGCIIAEFFNKKVFIRATTVNEYLKHLVELLGLPPEHI